MAAGSVQQGRACVADEVALGLQGAVRTRRGGAFGGPAVHGGEEVHAGERLSPGFVKPRVWVVVGVLVAGRAVGAAGGRAIVERVEVRQARWPWGGTIWR